MSKIKTLPIGTWVRVRAKLVRRTVDVDDSYSNRYRAWTRLALVAPFSAQVIGAAWLANGEADYQAEYGYAWTTDKVVPAIRLRRTLLGREIYAPIEDLEVIQAPDKPMQVGSYIWTDGDRASWRDAYDTAPMPRDARGRFTREKTT